MSSNPLVHSRYSRRSRQSFGRILGGAAPALRPACCSQQNWFEWILQEPMPSPPFLKTYARCGRMGRLTVGVSCSTAADVCLFSREVYNAGLSFFQDSPNMGRLVRHGAWRADRAFAMASHAVRA